MKRIILIFVLLTFLLSSCTSMEIINQELSEQSLKELFPEMYPMPVENCKHHILFSKPIDGMGLDYSSFDYHYEYCSYPNCEYEAGIRPHSERWRVGSCSESYIADDGFAYHQMTFICQECYKSILMSVRCRNNVGKCNSCYDLLYSFVGNYTLEEWEQIAKGEKEFGS